MIQTQQNASSISSMELRKQPGTILDRAFYRNETFIVEKSGEPRAAIISYAAFEKMLQTKKDARKRLFSRIDSMRKSFRIGSPAKKKMLIDEAIQATR